MNREDVATAGQGHSSVALAARSRLRLSTILKWVVQLSRFGLAALFLLTAVAKLTIIRDFATNVSQLVSASGFNYARWTWPVTIAVITAEVITAGLLLFRRTVRVGAVCAGFLLMGFAGFALYYVYVLHGEPLECGCFGKIIGSQLGVNTALRNLALLLPVLLVLFGYRRLTTNQRRGSENESTSYE
ncbi:MAG: MauE/DoxX family redox-associated membrane protein [Acidobacteriota bacterium]